MLHAQYPEELVKKRFSALVQGDFEAVYASYHPQSGFRQQFPQLEAYRDYARQELQPQLKVENWRILKKQCACRQAQVLVSCCFQFGGQTQEMVEVACLAQDQEQWRYVEGYRIPREECPADPEEMSILEVIRCSGGLAF